MTQDEQIDIYKRMGEASRRLCDDIILEAMRETSRQAETIFPSTCTAEELATVALPRETLWPYEYSGTLEQWRAWCAERGDLETLAEVEACAGMVGR